MCLFVTPAVRSSFYRNGHRVFNTHNDLSACCAAEDEIGTYMQALVHAYVLIWKDWEKKRKKHGSSPYRFQERS